MSRHDSGPLHIVELGELLRPPIEKVLKKHAPWKRIDDLDGLVLRRMLDGSLVIRFRDMPSEPKP